MSAGGVDMNKHTFYIVDVFAEEKYAGNQLAVFKDVQDLSDSEMQRIAKEMNYSETTFILSDEEKQEAKSVNDGTYKTVSKKELNRYKKLQTEFKKAHTKPVLIRFDVDDLSMIKKRAKAEGLPYQTYIKSTMHKAIIH